MRRNELTVTGFLAYLISTFALSTLVAYESYHDPASDGAGYCASCHPGFSDGKSDTLHALHTGGSDPVTTNCNLCHTGSGRDNPLIMWSSGDGLGCTGCHGRDYGETIQANYRGFPTATKKMASGHGLRKHHLNARVAECLDCHADVSDAQIFPENVNPPYYSRADVRLNGEPVDACSNEDTGNDGDTTGLDNDGDFLYDGEDSDCQAAEPDINLSPGALSFDAVTVGETATLSTKVQNVGTAALSVTLTQPCGGTSAEFSWSPDTAFEVAEGGSQTISVTYAPVDEGADTGCLVISSNDPDEPTQELALTGSGSPSPQPSIGLAPTLLDFGSVFVGEIQELTATVENSGTASLQISDIALCTGTSAEFTWTPDAPFTLDPGLSQKLTVVFAPVEPGLAEGCLEIRSNDPESSTIQLAVTGTGQEPPVEDPGIAVNPVSLEFGTVVVGDTATLTTEVRNTGGQDLVVSALAPCAATSTEFSWEPAAPFTVAPGQGQTLSVTYTPVDGNPDTGCLELHSNDPANAVLDVALSGTGEELPVEEPDIVLDPASLDFGAVLLGESQELTAEVKNAGTGSLEVSVIDLCGGTSTEYSWTPDAPFTVAPQESRTLKVVFTPAEPGLAEGCLAILSDDADTPTFELGLSGTGEEPPVDAPVIILEPEALNFRAVVLGEMAELTVKVKNAGTADLDIATLSLCDQTSDEYGWEPEAPFSIAPGQSRTLTMSYEPIDAGRDMGCLVILSNSPGSPTVELALTGNGAEPPLYDDIDLDIIRLTATKTVRLRGSTGSVKLSMSVGNNGVHDELRPATLVGMQGGHEVYSQTLMVDASPGKGPRRFVFPTHEVQEVGEIAWSLTIADDDADVDEATAVTDVREGGGSGGPVDPLLLALLGLVLVLKRRQSEAEECAG